MSTDLTPSLWSGLHLGWADMTSRTAAQSLVHDFVMLKELSDKLDKTCALVDCCAYSSERQNTCYLQRVVCHSVVSRLAYWRFWHCIAGCVQRALLLLGEHDGHHCVLVVPLHSREGQVQVRSAHLWLGDLHRGVPLRPDLQLLG